MSAVEVPVEVLDPVRFLCLNWSNMHNFIMAESTGNPDLLTRCPMIQGTVTQSALRTVARQPFEDESLGRALAWMIRQGESVTQSVT